MEYESLLNDAYNNVKVSEEVDKGKCGRFEVLSVAGHHEGTKTLITNFGKVALCLRRSPQHLMKFLTKELASSGEISGDRLILSRKLSSKDVNERIGRYVNLFVLCPKCKKPDTELEDSEGKSFLRCLACGNKHEVQRLGLAVK